MLGSVGASQPGSMQYQTPLARILALIARSQARKLPLASTGIVEDMARELERTNGGWKRSGCGGIEELWFGEEGLRFEPGQNGSVFVGVQNGTAPKTGAVGLEVRCLEPKSGLGIESKLGTEAMGLKTRNCAVWRGFKRRLGP